MQPLVFGNVLEYHSQPVTSLHRIGKEQGSDGRAGAHCRVKVNDPTKNENITSGRCGGKRERERERVCSIPVPCSLVQMNGCSVRVYLEDYSMHKGIDNHSIGDSKLALLRPSYFVPWQLSDESVCCFSKVKHP